MKRGAAVFAAVTMGLGACGAQASPESIETLPNSADKADTPSTPFKRQLTVWGQMPGETPAEQLGALDALINRCGSEILLSTRLALSSEEKLQYDRYYSILNSVSNAAIQTYCTEL